MATREAVNGIAKWGHNARCITSNAAFAARVDLDYPPVATLNLRQGYRKGPRSAA